ncbi:MAG: glycosyltransferase family 39 protein [Halobacteriales archaeon]|nr:glycosyltransferase family 39 protein [Halobacteriales archaeon]
MNLDRARSSVVAVAAFAVVVVAFVSSRVFPYHSSNHDEGVYLQHAEMLLDGRLRMHTGELTGAFRPWFFVADGGTVYPKYTPVSGALFAAGEAVYSYRLALVVVAFVNVLLVYAVASEVYDRRVGVLASAALVLSPLFVVQSSLFLSYAPTTVFNLGFALAYLRAWKRFDVRYAVAAGVCAGVAFFSRQYTAVVFALPFVVHAVYVVASERKRETATLYATTAFFGFLFVALALIYNLAVTGNALVFPYLEFAPNDGVGFGRREIFDHSSVYTPELALRANARVLRRFVVDWGPGGVVGFALAVVGVVYVLCNDGRSVGKLLLVGVAVSVIVGNVAFWGNLNILGDISNPQDGIVHLYGTLYHFDLLLPASVFAGAGLVSVSDAVRDRFDRRAAVSAVLVVAVVFAGVGATNTTAKVDENLELTESYESAYAPFEENEYEGVVFLPTPYGDWLNHPFQYLRNDPDLNGTTVYATDRGAENFDVIDAYPERDIYRYAYRGEWAPYEGVVVEPVVEHIRVVEDEQVGFDTTFEVPDDTTSVVAVLDNATETTYTEVVTDDGEATVAWRLNDTTAGFADRGNVALNGGGELTLEVTVTRRYDSFRYRQELAYEVGEVDGNVRVIAPPYTELCYSHERCGGEAVYTGDGVTTEVVAGAPEEEP